MKNLFFLFIILIQSQTSVFAQNYFTDTLPKKNPFRINGYIKNLNGLILLNNDETLQWGLIHNRINTKLIATNWLIGAAEIRNRILYGESVKAGFYTTPQLGADKGYIDLTFIPFDSKTTILISSIERLWAKMNFNKIELIIGRQRINWGLNMVWNPNDIFNTYSFIDFDYEERPGTDAIKARISTGEMSSIEIAAKPDKLKNKSIYAIQYKLNKIGYDIQTIGAIYQNNWMAGTGWAGSISNIGFKGELSYFNERNNTSDSSSYFTVSTEFDYTIQGKLYINSSYLYNYNGKNNAPNSTVGYFSNSSEISANNLSPTKHSIFLQLKTIYSPIFTASVSAIYFINANGIYVFPALSYSIDDKWEAAFFIQSLWNTEKTMNSKFNNTMLRFKYSF